MKELLPDDFVLAMKDATVTCPRVERKIAHLMRHKHGGRRVRVRARERVKQDFALLASSINLARLAALGIRIASTARVG